MTSRIVCFFVLFCFVDIAQAERVDLPRPSQVALQPNPIKAMLEHLKQHDARFKCRVLRVDKVWTERVDPHLMETRRRFLDMKFGQQTIGPDVRQLPEAFDQPHRVRYIVLVDDALVMRRTVKEFEKRIHSGYGSSQAEGMIWSYDGKREMKVFRKAGELGTPKYEKTDSSLIYKYVRPLQWTTGIGFGRLITKVTEVQSRGNQTVIFAEMNLYQETATTLTLYVDDDWIARKAIVSIQLIGGSGVNRFVIVTEGTQEIPGGLKVAESGQLLGDRFGNDYKVKVVSMSDTLTANQFARVIDPTVANETLSNDKYVGVRE